ncbi:hypothetical protein JCM8547_003074 [Rhodosporidiobolus lusitaniae]
MPPTSSISNVPPRSTSFSSADDNEKKDHTEAAVLLTLAGTDAAGKTTAPEETIKKNEAALGGLQRRLNPRQIGMISIAGTIGTGLFLGTGSSLITGGPGSLLINYSIIGALMFVLVNCVTEMVTQLPVAGAWPTYVHRFIDEPAAFAYGWLSVAGLSVAIAGDLVVTQLLIQWWTDKLVWLIALFFIAGLAATNLFTVKAYGELEYWLALLKVIAIVIFFIVGIVVNAGGNTDRTYIGAKNWTIGEAPFVNGFAGFASLFVNAAFAYGGTESVGIAAAEAKNPTRQLKRIASRILGRILVFYVLTVLLINFNVPYTYPDLSTASTATSPFTIVLSQAGARAGGSFMNVVILTSVLSACNMGLFGGSRILYGMSLRGHAPAVFSELTKRGVPWASTLLIITISLVFFGISFAPGGAGKIWTYCQAVVGVNNQFGWVFIGLSSWRMRSAWVKQGKPLPALKAPNPMGSWGAPIVVVSFVFIILVQGWSSFSPSFNAEKFVQSYLEIPVLFVLYWSFRLTTRSRTPSLLEVDLVTGTHEESKEDEEDNGRIERRERGKFGWGWKAYSWIA